MDPVTLIVGALAAGTAKAAEGTASQAVKDAYQGLKTLIQRRLAGNEDAEHALKKFEEKPEVYTAPLNDELANAGAAEDQELLEAAKRLEQVLEQAGESHVLAHGRAVAIAGSASNVNIVTGDHSSIGAHDQPKKVP